MKKKGFRLIGGKLLFFNIVFFAVYNVDFMDRIIVELIGEANI